MNAPESRRDTPQLVQLDRRNAWMWVMAVLLLVSLGASVVVVYLTQTGDELATFFPAPETRGLLADTLARTVASPAELPVGVITALVGMPVLLVLLARLR